MSKHLVFTLILCCIFLTNRAVADLRAFPDSLTSILKLSDERIKEKKLSELLNNRFLVNSTFDGRLNDLRGSLKKYHQKGADEFVAYARILIYRRNDQLDMAEKLLLKSISIAQQHSNDYLLYKFHLTLAYVQTDNGDYISAIHSYRLARKQADVLNDPRLQVSIDIGIADLYMHLQLYDQALTYLGQAQAYCNNHPEESRPASYVISNKAEIYFKLGVKDSLDLYVNRFKGTALPDAERITRRLSYFSLILGGNFGGAVKVIKEQLAMPGNYYKNVDRWYLADSYYRSGAVDSAEKVAQELISDHKINSAQLKLQSYILLAQIAQNKSDYHAANKYNKLALSESEAYRNRMMRVADLSSEIRLDQMDASYRAKTTLYKKEKTILIFAIIMAGLTVIVVGLFYNNVRQKHKYQKLLYHAETRELAFINSHEARKHLANIIGLCALLKDTEQNAEQHEIFYEHLYNSALELDQTLKNIASKLVRKPD
ncbi:tetratricopeptide repeat protein [Pedobacter duraquae]|uniref:Tetratricopeptide repeat protein n=1 Tax=Pedobacter duraquae TaxID=425511 RepID=A0A4R6IES5_9SPHI|nr:hypothetical protein [Pedobacter duraquae]TDO20810.1 hypothetical protein CLV32_3444 [Pedobacter duraquae]